MHIPRTFIVASLLALAWSGNAPAAPLRVKMVQTMRVAFTSPDGKVSGKRMIQAGTVVEVLGRNGNQLRVMDRLGAFTIDANATDIQQVLAAQQQAAGGRPARQQVRSQRDRYLGTLPSYRSLVGSYLQKGSSLHRERYKKSVRGKTTYLETTIRNVTEDNGKYYAQAWAVFEKFRITEAVAEQLRENVPAVVTGKISTFMQYKSYQTPYVTADGHLKYGYTTTHLKDVVLYFDNRQKGILVPLGRKKKASTLE